MGAALLALSAVAVFGLVQAPRSEAFVYYSNWTIPTTEPATIGRANLDGTGQDIDFLTLGDGAQPTGLSVFGSQILWADASATTLGTAALNGDPSTVEFPVATAIAPSGTAVNATHMFWTQAGSNSIGRANIDGSGGDQSFITAASTPIGVAVNATHIFWANQGTDKIGRAPINDPASANQAFIDTLAASSPSGLALDATHVYWSNYIEGTIGRAHLDGSNLQAGWISGLTNPCDLAIHAGKLYWAEQGDDAIGRADITPTGDGPLNVNQTFIASANNPCGVTVDNLSVPSCQDAPVSTVFEKAVQVTLPCDAGGGTPTFTLVSQPTHGEITGFDPATGKLTYTPAAGYRGSDSFQFKNANAGAESNVATANITVGPNSNDFSFKVKRNTKKGTATVKAKVPGAGSLQLKGKKVKGSSKQAAGAGTVSLPLKPKGTAKEKLNEDGAAKVKFAITFKPVGGDPATERGKVKLKKA